MVKEAGMEGCGWELGTPWESGRLAWGTASEGG